MGGDINYCMKLTVILACLLCLLSAASVGAVDSSSTEMVGLRHLSEYLGLLPEDISFRGDYTQPDSFRLQVVADLMTNPLGMIDYADAIKKAHIRTQPEMAAAYLFQDLAREGRPARSRAYQANVSEIQRSYSLYYTDLNLNRLLTQAAIYLDITFPRSTELSLGRLTSSERQFLRREFLELIVVHEEEEFFSVEAMDSLEKVEEEYTERFVKFGMKIDKDPIIDAGIECLRHMTLEVKNLQQALSRPSQSVEDMLNVTTTFFPAGADLEHVLGRQSGWAVGGRGNDYYHGEYEFILDFGGDDVYDLTYDPANPHGVIIIDLSGNDTYRAGSDFAFGSGCFSVGLLLDYGGNDSYDCRSFGLGSGYFGFGLVYDAEGDDRYSGDTFLQGAGCFGLGLLIDEGGRDVYSAALAAQGCAFTEGLGALYDLGGNDIYSAGGKYKDILRYEDHYYSFSQGFSIGFRPLMSGGIGVLVDGAGNDSYLSDIFAQATSYWWSLGVICDEAGNDSYHSFQYAQGAATHMSNGILVDDGGNDVYFSKGVSQGCGHDYSCGLLLDRGGDDTYTAYDLSQAAGSANGAGVLIDNSGDDRYFIKKPSNSQGYGNPRREFGSIGLFLDLGGQDQYAGNGHDNYYWRTKSKWGGGMDIELNPPDSSEGNK